ncbi:hypothetical protein PVAND_012369 [Polypedilum vanderplanki]|uniref:Major facilitator superfamily (MFS) profile domain-containing protein n=1 Tax=Polypedilum vanderplanki TaxID=319348 RepID=A0A9J6CMI1_POLVA|nr:hypothetical protein PVAND_012369 [Polypedilum vanderplanki]
MTLLLSYSLEDAISETKFGKFNYFMIVLSGLILGCGMIETNSINLVIPIASCELEMTNFHKGLLGSVGYIGIILASQLWGFLADTRGRKKIIVPALLFSFIFTILSTFMKNFWLLLVSRFLNGFCICAPQTIIYAFLGEFHAEKNRARVLIVASVMYGIFCLIIPINGILFLNQNTWNIHIPLIDLNYNAWRIFLLMCSVPCVISALLMIFFVPALFLNLPKFTYAQGDESKTLKILQRIHKFNTGRDDYKVTSLIRDKEFEDASNQKPKSFLEFLWSQTVPHLTSNSTVVTNDFQPTCVTKLEIQTLAKLTLLHSLFWFIISIIINRTGKLAIIVVIAFSAAISSITLMFLEYPQASLYIYLMIILAGVNMSVVNSSTVELYPTTLRAMAVSISMMFGRVGSVVGSNFVGLLIKNFCTYTFILPAVLMITGGILAFTIPNINKKHKN